MKNRRRSVAAAATIGLALAFSHTASAQTDDAATHAAKATHAYNVQDWTNALKEFRAAYQLDPKPQYLWAIAQTQRLGGDCRSAILTYKAYQRTASSDGYKQAQDWISKCQTDMAAQQQMMQQQQQPAEPTPAHTEHPAAPPPTAPKPEPEKPKEPGPWVLDPLGDVLFVLGIGGLAVGGVFLGLGDSHMSSAANEPTYQQYDLAVSSASTEQLVGVISLAGGAALTGLAIWRFIAVGARHTRERETAPAVSIVPQPGGAFVSYGLKF
jgi:hypothetical protein